MYLLVLGDAEPLYPVCEDWDTYPGATVAYTNGQTAPLTETDGSLTGSGGAWLSLPPLAGIPYRSMIAYLGLRAFAASIRQCSRYLDI